MTQTHPRPATDSSYETCRTCGCSPCECPRGGKSATAANFRDPAQRGGRRLSWIDWIEFIAVCVLVWLVVARPPIPGLDGGCSGAGT